MEKQNLKQDSNITVSTFAQLSRPSIKGADDRLGHSLEKMYDALMARKVEPICCAFQVVTKLCKSESTPSAIDVVSREIGEIARKMVVSAYSHRHCFMCAGGVTQCESCDGSGETEPGRKCFTCEGMGMILCDFCHGTGWTDKANIPPELWLDILGRYLIHVKRDIEKITQAYSNTTVEMIGELTGGKRFKRLATLMRVHAQTGTLLKTEVAVVPQQKQILEELFSKTEEYIKLFSPSKKI